MPTRGRTSQLSQPKGFLQAYASDLRGWAGGIAVRHVIAVALSGAELDSEIDGRIWSGSTKAPEAAA